MLMPLQQLLLPAFCAEGWAPTAGPHGHLQGRWGREQWLGPSPPLQL